MKAFLVLAVGLLFCGCAETRIYDRGDLAAVIQGDATNVTLQTKTVTFHADTLNHSAPTAAAYRGGAQIISATGSAVVSGLLAHP